MKPVARMSDISSHGGRFASGSVNVLANLKPLLRIGDVHICPIHGTNVIVEGAPRTFSNMRPLARLGDSTSCGAVIVSGSTNVLA